MVTPPVVTVAALLAKRKLDGFVVPPVLLASLSAVISSRSEPKDVTTEMLVSTLSRDFFLIPAVGGDGCSALCALEKGFVCPSVGSACLSVCGDSLIVKGEACDDGNNKGGDGCSSACAVEAGWVCDTPGTPCRPRCGDKLKVGAEECDDGNTVPLDGCSAACTVEKGWTCATPGAACTGTHIQKKNRRKF